MAGLSIKSDETPLILRPRAGDNIIQPTSPAVIGEIIRAATSQTADLQQWQDSNGNPLALISSSGAFAGAGTVNESTTFPGVHIGRAANSSRITFANGTGASNWQIDADHQYGNNFRWYLPGSVKMTLSTAGTLSPVNGLVTNFAQFFANNSGINPLVVKGAGSQTADLQRWEASDGSLLSSITAAGAGFFGGVIASESTTVPGVHIGRIGAGSRITIANGTGSQNWQIDQDSYSGDFRWYQPGQLRMSLSDTGRLSLIGGYEANARGSAFIGRADQKFAAYIGYSPTPIDAPLNARNDGASVYKPGMQLQNLGGGSGAGIGVDFASYTGDATVPNEASIRAIDDGYYSAFLSFWTKTPGSATNPLVERVRFNSGGGISIYGGSSSGSGGIDVSNTRNVVFNSASVLGDKINLFSDTLVNRYGIGMQGENGGALTLTAGSGAGGVSVRRAPASGAMSSGQEVFRLNVDGTMAMPYNVVSEPAAPTVGGILYVFGGALKYVGSSGTRTTIAPA